MSEQMTSSQIADDIRRVDNYVRAVERAGSSCTEILFLLMYSALAGIAAFIARAMILGLAVIFAGIVFAIFITKKRTKDAFQALPEAALARIVSSDEEQAKEALFRLHESKIPEIQEPVTNALILFLQSASDSESKIGGIPLRDRLLSMLSRFVSSAAHSQSNLMVTVVETIARFRITSAMSYLLLLANTTPTNAGSTQLRETAAEAVAVLSPYIDFGSKAEIPVKVEQFYRHHYLETNLLGEPQPLLLYSLVQLLPTLTKEDAGLFDQKHREYLYSLCKVYEFKRNFSELKQAMILALGAMEDTDAIPTLTTLANMSAPTDHEQDTRNLARKHLALLTQIKNRQSVGSTLLRASDAPNTPAEQLLRPVASTEETQPEMLLRPHLGD